MITTPKENLPRGMALVETSDGRWFPAIAPHEEKPRLLNLVSEDDVTCSIPPALGLLDDPHQGGYACREQAIEAYQAWHEAAILPLTWRKLAAHTELYPERNAWYLDEIARLTGDDGPFLSQGADVYAVAIAIHHGFTEAIDAVGDTPDEAIEALYHRVYEWACQSHYTERLAS